MRPADVCGCSKKPRFVSSAISLRMVADEKSISGSWAMVFEPTGSAVRIYKSTIALRIFCFRSDSSMTTPPVLALAAFED